MHTPSDETLELLERLIAFDTTSRNSNLELIAFVQSYLAERNVDSKLVFDEDRRKANLYATIGPTDIGGIALSGHTDVVPVDGQEWSTEPFALTRRGSRLFARGTSDMKSFVAVCLAFVPKMAATPLRTPLHLMLSYDEEIGCLGVRRLIEQFEAMPVRPIGCIVGEPTSMKVVRAHKGKLSMRCHVHGLESHSGLTHKGVNAVEAAAETVAYLKRMARRFRDGGPFDPELDPPYTTVHTGIIKGGTQLNIVPKKCSFDFEFRHLPENDPDALLEEVRSYVGKEILPEMHAVSGETGFEWEPLPRFPALATDEGTDIVRLVQSLTGANTTGKVSFGTEGGLLSQAGIPCVVCGPGSIEQAHKPDEFIDLDQIAQCEVLIDRLIERLAT